MILSTIEIKIVSEKLKNTTILGKDYLLVPSFIRLTSLNFETEANKTLYNYISVLMRNGPINSIKIVIINLSNEAEERGPSMFS